LAEGVNGVKDALAIDSGDTVTDVLAGCGPKTVCFPSTACFGATWNTDLIHQLGEALGTQAREEDIATIMGPGVNLHRDPRCGRNFEYFSEDPYITGRLSAAMINGIQEQGVGACVKHFVANDAKNFRRSYKVVDPSGGIALRELYLAAFQNLLRYSNPAAIMTS
jgi:beta-glucosidase